MLTNNKNVINKRIKEGAEWISNNKEIAIVAIPVIGKLGSDLLRSISGYSKRRIDYKHKNEFCYDAKAGHNWQLKRKLSNQEWLEVERRKQRGEALGSILCSIGVLK